MLCDDLDGWDGIDGREVQELYIYICIYIADSWFCTAEINNIVKQLCCKLNK